MDTQQPQHDTDFPKTDPALDALLDEAVSAGTPPVDPGLADRIYHQTLPMLGRRPVLARIGPTLLRVAAAIAIIAGGLIAVTMMSPQQPTEPTLVVVPDESVETIAPELAAIDSAIEPGNTVIDEQMDLLALRVDLVSNEDTWGDDSLSPSDRLERAVVRFEIDQFNDDTTLLWVDEPTLF